MSDMLASCRASTNGPICFGLSGAQNLQAFELNPEIRLIEFPTS